MLGATAIAGLASALETLINKALTYDPGSRALLQSLEGQVLAVHCTSPAITVYWLLGEPVRLQQYYEGTPTAALTGSARDLLKLAAAGDSHSLHGTGVTLEGRAALLGELRTLLKQLEIDWEMWLADTLGTLPAHVLARQWRAFGDWAQARGASASRLGEEYLSEESAAALGRREFEIFCEDISDTRLALDRLEARVASLATKHHG